MSFFGGFLRVAGTAIGTYFGMPTVGAAIGNAAAGWVDRDKSEETEQNTATAPSDLAGNLGSVAGAGLKAYAGYESQQRTNDQLMANQQATNAFNASEAQKGRDFNYQMFGQQAEFNRSEAASNRLFQERMSGSQYQRAVGDMQAAGLNPMLAVSQGGAGTPSGNAASASSSGAPTASGTAPPNIANSAKTALEMRNLEKQGDVLDAQATNIETTTEMNTASTGNIRAQTKVVERQADKMIDEIELLKAQTKNTKAQSQLVSMQTMVAETMVDLNKGNLSVANANARLSRLRADLVELDKSKGEAYSDYYKGAGKAEPYMHMGESAARIGGNVLRRGR